MVHEPSYEFAKPSLIQNKGSQGQGHTHRRTFSRGLKSQANMMQSGRAVVGLPYQSDPQHQTLESSAQPGDDCAVEMTPDQSKDKPKRKGSNIAENSQG